MKSQLQNFNSDSNQLCNHRILRQALRFLAKCFWVFFGLFNIGYQVLFASNILNDRLKSAKVGDYFVTEANKMTSLIAVRSNDENLLVLEEISVPSAHISKQRLSWGDWVIQRAPGHTSWSMIEIDLKSNQLIECYSFSRSGWINLSESECFISTLFNLDLAFVPEPERRRMGPEPLNGEPDLRPIWYPQLMINGESLAKPKFDVYSAHWPRDNSELSNHPVMIYFDHENRSPFPIWIQLNTAHVMAPIRTIDAGHELPSYYKSMPHRVPEFLDPTLQTPGGIQISLKSPRYYRQFDLYAVDWTKGKKEFLPISCSLNMKEEVVRLEISRAELLNVLQPNHRYTWLIVPTGHCESYAESTSPFTWKVE